jgi:hypothetical protein
VVYVLGAGVGESVVVAFPDGRHLVADAACIASDNLPAVLLDHLGAKTIDLMVATHPDVDHVRGMAKLLDDFKPRALWRYPQDAAARDFLVRWSEDAGYADLAQALRAFDRHLTRTGATFDAAYGFRSWPVEASAFKVTSLAPTPVDRDRAMRLWEKLIGFKGGRARLTRLCERAAVGSARLGDAPNVVSLALAIEWASHRVLLGGDVMNGLLSGPQAPRSGWKGILAHLTEDGLGHLLDDSSVVKVAHHGSRHSFELTVWQRHSQSRKTLALLAPYQTGLPDTATLGALRAHVDTLAIAKRSSAVDARAASAGWKAASAPHRIVGGDVPVAGAVLRADGTRETFATKAASGWT